MGTTLYTLVLFFVMWPANTLDLDAPALEDRLPYGQLKRHHDDDAQPCMKVQPSNKDIIKRFYAILPYFDREHANTAFLHKFRATVHGLADTEDLLDREAAFHAAVLTPLIFLQQYRDTWCLFERFHRALRLYQISHPTEKRSALKLLQNFRAVNNKVRIFVSELPGPAPVTRSTTSAAEDDELHDKKDFRFVNELIKNFG